MEYNVYLLEYFKNKGMLEISEGMIWAIVLFSCFLFLMFVVISALAWYKKRKVLSCFFMIASALTFIGILTFEVKCNISYQRKNQYKYYFIEHNYEFKHDGEDYNEKVRCNQFDNKLIQVDYIDNKDKKY